MKITITTSLGKRIIPLSQVKSIHALSQSNLVVTKVNGETTQGISVEFE